MKFVCNKFNSAIPTQVAYNVGAQRKPARNRTKKAYSLCLTNYNF